MSRKLDVVDVTDFWGQTAECVVAPREVASRWVPVTLAVWRRRCPRHVQERQKRFAIWRNRNEERSWLLAVQAWQGLC
jgi:hypothetical protein